MTDNKKRPVGELFSRAYGERGVPIEDSPVFRRRLGAYLQRKSYKNHFELSTYLDIEAGLIVPTYYATTVYYKWDDYYL